MKELINHLKHPVNPVYPVKNMKLRNEAKLFSVKLGNLPSVGSVHLWQENTKQTQFPSFSTKKQWLPKKQSQIEPISPLWPRCPEPVPNLLRDGKKNEIERSEIPAVRRDEPKLFS